MPALTEVLHREAFSYGSLATHYVDFFSDLIAEPSQTSKKVVALEELPAGLAAHYPQVHAFKKTERAFKRRDI